MEHPPGANPPDLRPPQRPSTMALTPSAVSGSNRDERSLLGVPGFHRSGRELPIELPRGGGESARPAPEAGEPEESTESMSEMEPRDLEATLREATSAIESAELERAVAILRRGIDAGDDTGECLALLGLVRFRMEDYASARDHYEAALARSGARSEWQEMRDHAGANALARVREAVPPVEYFDPRALLAPPPVKDGALPGPPPPIRIGGFRRALEGVGNGIALLATLLWHGTVQLHGLLFGYRSRVWTNWYKRGPVRAILTLAYMRDLLNRKNLYNTYPKGRLIGFQEKDQL